jgi:hypothetical protein
MLEGKTTIKALGIGIGQELMTTVSDLTGAWNECGDAASVVITIFKGVMSAVDLLVFAIRAAVNYITGAFMGMWDAVGHILKSIGKFFTGDFKGALDEALQVTTSFKAQMAIAAEEIAENYDRLGDSLEKRWRKKSGGTTGAGAQGGATESGAGADGGSAAAKSASEDRMSVWNNELKKWQGFLAIKAEMNGQYFEMSLEQERGFWKAKQELDGLSEKEAESLTIKLLDIDDRLRKERVKAAKSEADTQARIAADLAQFQHQTALSEIGEYRNTLDHKVAMGGMLAQQRLEAEANLIKQEHALRRASLEAQIEAGNISLDQKGRLCNELLALDDDFNRKLAANARDMALEQKAIWMDLEQTIQGSFTDAFMGLVNGTQSWGDATRNMLNSVLQSFIRTTAAQLAQHMTIENLKTLFSSKATAARTAIKTAGAAQESTLEIAGASKSILANAWAASAGAFKAMVSIPYVGPALGAAAAATVLGAVLSMMGKLNSAEEGWGQVPSDQLAAIHKNEMVLPAKYAEPLRQQLEGGEGIGGGGGDVYHINALDAKSFEDYLSRNKGALSRAVRSMGRDNVFQG